MSQKLLLLITFVSFINGVSAAKKPNIVFFLVDDMGIHDTSVPFHYENKKPVVNKLNKIHRTPNMQKLADSGRLFTNAYAYSVCSPTRISIMNGQSAVRHKVTNWTHPKSSKVPVGPITWFKGIKSPEWNKAGLDLSQPTLPGLLRQNGYNTLFAGKAHFGPDDTPMGNPINCGFDISIAGYGGGAPGSYLAERNYQRVLGREGIWDVPGLEKYHGSDVFLSEAITLEMNQAIENSVKAKKPFFSYMSHYAIHSPFDLDKRFKDNYPTLKGAALGMATLIEGMDKSLGDMIRKLEELKVAEETLIIFYSDNGSDSPLWNKPLRGKKGHRHEGGLRVPLIVSWAKPNPNNPMQKNFNIPSGSIDERMVTCVDIFPSILKIAGTQSPTNYQIDGYDRSSYFTGEQKPVGKEQFIVHFPHQHNNTLFSAFVSGKEKIIYNYGQKTWEYYLLNKDLGENKNLAKEQPKKASALAQQMIQELDRLGVSYPQETETGKEIKPDLSILK